MRSYDCMSVYVLWFSFAYVCLHVRARVQYLATLKTTCMCMCVYVRGCVRSCMHLCARMHACTRAFLCLFARSHVYNNVCVWKPCTVNIQNFGAAKFRHFTIFDISAAIYFRRGVEGMV